MDGVVLMNKAVRHSGDNRESIKCDKRLTVRWVTGFWKRVLNVDVYGFLARMAKVDDCAVTAVLQQERGLTAEVTGVAVISCEVISAVV